jgi:hypothetical protein
MAERNTVKRGLGSTMKPAAETFPNVRGPNVPGPVAEAKLESDLQAHIGRELRSVYNEVLHEPVPDRFLRLLEELEQKKPETP